MGGFKEMTDEEILAFRKRHFEVPVEAETKRRRGTADPRVVVSRELHERVGRRAAREGRSLTSVVRRALEAYLRPGNRPAVGAGLDEEEGS